MATIPPKRLLVYVISGILVLLIGTLGLLAMRDDPARGELVLGEVLSAEEFGLATGDPILAGAVAEGTTPGSSTTTSTTMIYVQVAGAVRRPGVYRVFPDARVFQAVIEAGGFTEEADQQALSLAARLKDGCRVYVPRVGETVVAPLEPTAQEAGDGGGESAGPVSLNSATLEQLDSLPGIGPAIARDIITFRETNGPFTSVDQLTDVPGIGPARLEQLRPLVGL